MGVFDDIIQAFGGQQPAQGQSATFFQKVASTARSEQINPGGFQAWTRGGIGRLRSPVRITRDPDNSVSGSFNPTSQVISLNIPKGSPPAEAMDALKHELVHQVLQSRPLPTLGETPHSILDAWNASSRGGYARDEIPAYLTVDTPGQMKNLSLEDRNSYVTQLFRFLSDSARQNQVQDPVPKIKELLISRAAYDSFPDQNVGEVREKPRSPQDLVNALKAAGFNAKIE